jgi:hypothetical protein
MLKGSCRFADFDEVNQCCTDILEALKKEENKDIKIIELQNRLDVASSDLVLKILFKDVITEMVLIRDLKDNEEKFKQQIEKLQKPKFFSSVTQLFIVNEEISSKYLPEVKTVIRANTRQGN